MAVANRGRIVAATVTMLFLVPAFSPALLKAKIALHGPVSPSTEDEHTVAGGVRISGFLVVADKAEVGMAVPEIRWSKFVQLITMIGLEDETGPLLKDLVAKTPFAFVMALRFDAQSRQLLYIAPPDLIEQCDRRLHLLPPHTSFSPMRQVLTAERLP